MLNLHSNKKQKNIFLNNQINNKKEDKEKRLFFWRIIINIVLSLILIIIFFITWNAYTTWKLFFFITIWSFWSNTFYLISITIIDICIYRGKCQCTKFNNWVRNYFLRIFFPFSIGTVIIYWELVLLGDSFQALEETVLDIIKNFFINGLVLIFVVFDIFTSHHINKNNNCKWDIIIISIIMAIHFGIVIISKEYLDIYQWDFLIIADFRQIIGSFIIMYLIILNGYVIFYLISDYFFDNDKIDDKKKDELIYNCENYIIEKKNEEKYEEKFEEKFKVKFDDKNKEKIGNNWEKKKNNEMNEDEDIKEHKKDEINEDEKYKEKNNIEKINEIEEKKYKMDEAKNCDINIIIKKNKVQLNNKKSLHIIIPENNNNEEKK